MKHVRLPCPSPTPGLIQTHVHCVGDAIQPSYPLSPPFPPALNLSEEEVEQSLTTLIKATMNQSKTLPTNSASSFIFRYNLSFIL